MRNCQVQAGTQRRGERLLAWERARGEPEVVGWDALRKAWGEG